MLEIGIKGEASTVVEYGNTAEAIGSGNLPVFSTPSMLSLMEMAALKSVAPYLEEGQSTVGTSASFNHLSATPLGMSVRCESVLTGISGRRLDFEVKAFDECGLIGEGSHSRFIIDAERFLAKTRAKSEEISK